MFHRINRRSVIAASLGICLTLGQATAVETQAQQIPTPIESLFNAQVISPGPVEQRNAQQIAAPFSIPFLSQIGPILASVGGAALLAILATTFKKAPATTANNANTNMASKTTANANVATNSKQCASASITPNYGPLATADAIAVVEETNRVRVAQGLCPVVWDEELANLSKGWGDHLVRTGKFEHPTHGNFSENLFLSNQYNSPNAQDAVQKWMDSAGHRRNLLDANVKRIGVYITKHDGRMSGGLLYVQRFR